MSPKAQFHNTFIISQTEDSISSDMPARLFTMPPSNGRQHAVT